MARSNVAKGAYYKARTRKWLLAQGHQVAEMEVIRWLWTPRGRIPQKRDQFGADLIAMNEAGIIFVQVKGGEAARTGNFPDARREFDKYTFPANVERWVIAWAPRSREPRIVPM